MLQRIHNPENEALNNVLLINKTLENRLKTEALRALRQANSSIMLSKSTVLARQASTANVSKLLS